MVRPGLVLASTLLCTAGAASADLVHLHGGRTVEGLVIEIGDEIEVEGRHGSVRIARAKVERIEKKPVPWLEFENRRSELAPGDAAGHFRLAVYCRENGLKPEALAELLAAVEADPNFEPARKALGHRKVGDRWMTEEEYQQALGFVLYEGEWIKPEQARLREEMVREKKLREALKLRVAELVEQTGYAEEKTREGAYQALEKIEPEVRIPVLRAATGHQNPAVRMYAILELGRMKVQAAAGDLAVRILTDPSPSLREMGVAALQNVEHDYPAGFFVTFLNDGRPDVRIRATAAITLFPDKRLAGPLLDALEKSLNRRYPTMAAPGGGVVSAFDRDPGRFEEKQRGADSMAAIANSGAIDVIGLAETERMWIRRALKACTGYDFGINLQLWRFWWAKELERRAQSSGKED